jgi:cyclic pyranopterin phosphate synthase
VGAVSAVAAGGGAPGAGRRVDYLRLSVTDRCNLRCIYCMPPGGVPPRRHEDILTYEELLAFAAVAVRCGVSKVRLTGGEPLVRRDLPDFVARLARTTGLDDISLTTNGILLPRFAADLRRAGLRRVNVSLDSLDPARYARLTRGGSLDEALAGLEAALSGGLAPVKVNTLLLEGVEEELDAFVALTRELPVHVRFIEFMPVDRRLAGPGAGRLVAAGDVLRLLAGRHRLTPHPGPYGHGPAQYWQADGARGTLGFIAGVSDHFCGACNRLRLTADGHLRTCLFSGEEVDVRPLLAQPGRLRETILAAVAAKRFDRRRERLANGRAMSEIGG